MEGTLLQNYATDLVNNLIRKYNTLSDLGHNLSKGEIREIFVSELLRYFLPDHLGIGTGIIINQASIQSNQTDIIIFDKRIFPSILGQQSIGIYPIEAVVGVIEVKSSSKIEHLNKCQVDFAKLKGLQDEKYQYRDKDKIAILKGFIGFKPAGYSKKRFRSLDISEFNSLNAICIVSKFSLLQYRVKKKLSWIYSENKIEKHEEIKRFICWFVDNLRLISNQRMIQLSNNFRSWTSIYFRHQDKINNYFR